MPMSTHHGPLTCAGGMLTRFAAIALTSGDVQGPLQPSRDPWSAAGWQPGPQLPDSSTSDADGSVERNDRNQLAPRAHVGHRLTLVVG